MAKKDELTWCMPASVLNGLWGTVMGRLAATMWRGKLHWPPNVTGQRIHGGMEAFPVEGEALEEFWNAVAEVFFGKASVYQARKAGLEASLGELHPDSSEVQRAAHVVLRYFDPNRSSNDRIRLRVIRSEGYDFVLSSEGLDLFVPPDPFVDDNGARSQARGRAEILKMYKFRETSNPPIALPGLPATGHKHGYFVPIPQVTNPTGAYQLHEDWARGAAKIDWWLTGSAYRGMMNQLPRVIASLWYESVAWPDSDAGDANADQRTILADFEESDGRVDVDGATRPTGLRRLLEERTETPFPRAMRMDVLRQGDAVPGLPEGSPTPDTWDECDVMLTNLGLFFPHPGDVAPDVEVILDAIEAGVAGNPVFTDSGL